jgi:Leucine-rich repeat (LRR) protein
MDLQVLDLSWTGLDQLSPEVWELTSLTALLLGNNQLTTLPSPPPRATLAADARGGSCSKGASGANGGAGGCQGLGPGLGKGSAKVSSSSSSGRFAAAGRQGWPRLKVLSLVNNKLKQVCVYVGERVEGCRWDELVA